MMGLLAFAACLFSVASLDVDLGFPLHVTTDRTRPVGVVLCDDAPRRWRGMLVATDFFGSAVTVRVDRTASAGESVRVTLPPPQRFGAWSVEARMDDGSEVASTRFACVPENGRSPRPARDAFAMGCQIQLPGYTPEDRQLAVRAAETMGAKVVRLNFCSFKSVCEKGPDCDFTQADAVMALLEPMGVKVCANIYGTPKWARRDEDRGKTGEPWYAYPPREGLYRDFCRELAAHYGEKISWYEIGNEWDLLPADVLSLEDGVRILREAYEGIKAGCPSARVVPNGWAVATGASLAQARPDFQESLMESAKGSYDAHAIHIHGPYSHYVRELEKFFAWRTARGIVAPWFPNETALTCVNGQERAAARDVWRKILYGWAHGAVSHSWYQLRSDGDNPKSHGDNYGLMTRRFYPRYTFAAFAALTHLLNGATFAGAYCDTPVRQVLRFKTVRGKVPEIAVVGFDVSRTDGNRIDVSFSTDAKCVLSYDLMGNEIGVEPDRDGRVTLRLDETPCALRFIGATFAKTAREEVTRDLPCAAPNQQNGGFVSARPIRLDPAVRMRLTATFEHEAGFVPRLHTAGGKVLAIRLNGRAVENLEGARSGENTLELEVMGDSVTAEVEESGKTCAATPDSFAAEPCLGTPPEPSFRAGAAVRPEENAFAPFGRRLDEIADRAGRTFPDGTLAAERTGNRLKMARRCLRLGQRAMRMRTADGDGRAVLAFEELRSFVDSFEEEFLAWSRHPDNPAVEPVRVPVASSGELYGALEKVRSLAGSPAVIELGAGEFHLNEVVSSGYPLDVPAAKLSAQFPVFGLTNLLIVGKGPERTRIVFDNYRATGLCIVRSRNVTVRGLELDWNEIPFSEGLIRAFDRESGTVDVTVKPGTLRPDDVRFAQGDRRLVCGWFDREGHVIERPFLFVRGRAAKVGDGLYRFQLDMDGQARTSAPLEVGQTLTVPDREGFLTAGCVYSDFCTFEDVTIRSARSSAFSSTHTRQEAVWKCRIQPRPGLYLSSNADGFYCSRGSYISKCEFRGMNDDGTNPHGNCAKIAERLDARTLRLTHVSPMRAGELCQFVRSPSGVTLQLNRLVRQRPAEGGLVVTFERDLPQDLVVGAHDYMFTPVSDGTGFTAVDNVFSEIRNNAMVIQCPHALIERNRADHVLKGLHLCGLIYGGWCEGPAPYDVLVRKNDFRDVRIGFSTGALMHTGVARCAPISDVTIAANRVTRAVEQAGEFRNLSDATVVGNTFVDSPLPLDFVRCERVNVTQCVPFIE